MAAPRAFISFQMEDRWARGLIVQQARDGRNDIAFQDYSVQDPLDSTWKIECARRIRATHGTIVLIGRTTWQSGPVIWEIEETVRQGHHLFGIQIDQDKTHPVPKGLPAENVIQWDFDQIAKLLKTWT